MPLTDMVIITFIVLLLSYALYEGLIISQLKGPVRLEVQLQRRAKLDSLIFIGLLLILLWKNISQQGSQLTTTLLLVLIFMAIWLFWLRRPRLLLKNNGLFFSGIWIDYRRIQNMNLTEDGILVMQLEKRRLLVAVRHLDDLEKIYHAMVAAG